MPNKIFVITHLMLAALLAWPWIAFAQSGDRVITAVTPGEFPPQYSVDSSGRPQGFAIDVLNAIAGLAGLEVEYQVRGSWSEAQEALKQGQADVLPNVGITERRRSFLDFTSPVETFPVVIFVRADTEGIRGREDLAGRRVAVVQINAGYSLLRSREDLELVLASNRQDALFKLLSGQADAMVYPEPLIRLDLRRAGIEEHLKVVGKPLQEIRRGIGVAKGQPELVRRLDRAVQQFVTSRAYRSIYTKWYGQPDTHLDPKRVASAAALLLAFLGVLFLLWRTRLQKRVALEMEKTVQERTAELRKSEQLFRKIYDHMAVGIARVSIDFRIAAANDAYCRMLGYSEQELIGKHLKDITHSETLEENLEKQSLLTQGKIDHYRMEKRFIHKNGSVVHGILDANLVRDAEGGPFFFMGSVLDITERKQAEEALRESERRLSTLMSNLPGMAYRCRNDRDWTMEFVSNGCIELTGYRPKDLVGNRMASYASLVHPDDQEMVWDKVQAALTKKRNFEIEYRIFTLEGSQKCVWEKGVGIFDNGQLLFLEGFISDITERKTAEMERGRLESQLLQSQKMESVGRLAGGVAHDLNNMLVAILGYGELLMADAGLEDRHKRRVELMHQAGLRSKNLVSQLLAFSRKQTLQVESLDISQVISDFIKLLEKTIRENIEMEYSLASGLPAIDADRSQLEQVILNLAINAQDAMPEGGRLTIETEVADLDEIYASQHFGVSPGRYVKLAVSDTGIGMDRETREQIFEPFFTTKNPGEGTGLGLATVYGIVKQHQGSIWVYSELGQGTTFKIYLPAAGPAQAGSATAVQARQEQTGGLETVLVVEDDDMVRELAVSMLEDQGYTVLTAASGQECLELVNSSEERFDLMLTDVIMPDMNGKTLFEMVVRHDPDIRVLYMSGYTDNVISHHGVLDKGVAFLQKPFSFQDLCLKVREVLDSPAAGYREPV